MQAISRAKFKGPEARNPKSPNPLKKNRKVLSTSTALLLRILKEILVVKCRGGYSGVSGWVRLHAVRCCAARPQRTEASENPLKSALYRDLGFGGFVFEA